jgi:hypothetical protein
LDEYKKKTDREMEAVIAKLDEMKTINDRLEKSKKKLQQEVKIIVEIFSLDKIVIDTVKLGDNCIVFENLILTV